ncbi:SMI1/KNR4 family protein [Streptomyces sp. NPDC088354]|uniref:SMI1/KNR4 family protein n=1 Tax=Streptomyces sp. NPDC088354 TaxID=3365856 RepID=UPI0037F46A77
MRPVDAAWSRVEQWLETRAPLVRDALRPAATQAEIDGASARLGAELPDDLASLLRLHDGAEDTDAGRFLSGMRLLPLREIESAHRGMCSMLTGDDLVGIWWHAQWIPFAANHDGWSRLYLDVRPGPGSGAVGSFFMESGGERRWPSLTVYLEQVAASLEDGAPLNHRTPRVAGDGLVVWDWQAPPPRPQLTRRRRPGG